MDATLLTAREYQMVELTAFGLAQKEIADKLRISAHTVDVTIRHAKEKLYVQKSTELAAWYFISNYKITLNISPITRAMVSLSFLALMLFAIIDGFNPERQMRSIRTQRQTASRTLSRTRRADSSEDYQLKIV